MRARTLSCLKGGTAWWSRPLSAPAAHCRWPELPWLAWSCFHAALRPLPVSLAPLFCSLFLHYFPIGHMRAFFFATSAAQPVLAAAASALVS